MSEASKNFVGGHDGVKKTDISELLEVNKGVKRLPWERRAALIRATFPSIVDVDWVAAFDDLDMMGQLIQDVLKVEVSDHHTDGPRPRVSMEQGLPLMHQIFGQDYSELPFPEAFRSLATGEYVSNENLIKSGIGPDRVATRTWHALSTRALESKIGLSHTQISKLMRGQRQPSLRQIEMIAKAFNKEPGWFLDYRIGIIIALVADRMARLPGMSVRYYQRVTGKR